MWLELNLLVGTLQKDKYESSVIEIQENVHTYTTCMSKDAQRESKRARFTHFSLAGSFLRTSGAIHSGCSFDKYSYGE